MRVFIALELPSVIKEAAAAIQRELMKSEAHVGWARTDGMHLTLKFLGEVSASQLSEIEKALESAVKGLPPPAGRTGAGQAGTGSMKITVRGIGVFPNPRNPRVVWLGIQPEDDRLLRLQERIDRALAPLGFPPERRDFRPHLTLGRVKSSRGLDDLMKVMAVHHHFLAGECTLGELHLMQSELKREGAVYTKLWSVAL
ncbi:MAG: RNA 2',3'-cyclic phosphodiesterase [Nitrospirae bacterium]|nr:RNA 2',3'-cyclic phosphodiesterase [Nitrospirota bacterium]